MPPTDIYSYVKEEEGKFQTQEIRVGENWYWNFMKHVQMIFHLKNGIFYTGENNWLRAFKNIMNPLIKLSNWTEDIEVKDIILYVENAKGRVLSFLLKKYHDEVYTKEHDVDAVLDDITDSDNTYGGALVQTTDDMPEVIEPITIAFCDQVDILSGVIAFKYQFSPSKLKENKKLGWGNEKNGATISIDDLIVLANNQTETVGQGDSKNERSSKVIDVYIVKGDMPEHYLEDNNNMEDYVKQIQVIAFYQNKEGKKEGVCLYRKKDEEESLFFHSTDEIYGRALGRGDGEALLHPQIWENFLTIHKMNMLEAGSKVPLYTDDENYKDRQRIQGMENLEITTVADNKRIYQVPTLAPANIQLFEASINEWYQHAQLTASAFDPVLGKEATSGTTFRGQERVVQQGKGLHEMRKGKRAKFIELLYRKIIIPKIKKEILKGQEFLATLTSEEMAWISDQLAENYVIKKQLEEALDFQELTDKEILRQQFFKEYAKKGNKLLLKILKDEFRDIEIKIGINVAGKQKDLFGLSDKILSTFQYIMANPQGFVQAMQIPGLSKSFNDILEYGGISQVDFAQIMNMPQPQAPQAPQEAQPQLSPLQLNAPVTNG